MCITVYQRDLYMYVSMFLYDQEQLAVLFPCYMYMYIICVHFTINYVSIINFIMLISYSVISV